MNTNILALPLAEMKVQTANNEDWIDSIVFLVGSSDIATAPQLDLRGIRFEFEIRRAPPESEVVLHGSTDDGRLTIGTPPDYGFLIFNIMAAEMKTRFVYENYVGDILATDGTYSRRCISFTLDLVQGITR